MKGFHYYSNLFADYSKEIWDCRCVPKVHSVLKSRGCICKCTLRIFDKVTSRRVDVTHSQVFHKSGFCIPLKNRETEFFFVVN